MDNVIKNVCCYSGKVLEKFTHSETPWLSTRGELPESVASDRIIPKGQIGDYFSEVKEKYKMINPNVGFPIIQCVMGGNNIAKFFSGLYNEMGSY